MDKIFKLETILEDPEIYNYVEHAQRNNNEIRLNKTESKGNKVTSTNENQNASDKEPDPDIYHTIRIVKHRIQ